MLTLSYLQLGEQDFADGGHPTLASVAREGENEPYPFRDFIGSDSNIFAPSNASFSFTTSNVSVGDIDDLAMLFGIGDHDSQSPGDQVQEFTIDGIDFTPQMSALLESSGGSQAEYNLYKFVFPPAAVAAVSDGSAEFVFRLQGPTIGDFGVVSQTNGAFLDFVRIGPSCSINLAPLQVEGNFAYNAGLDRCEANGTILISNSVGPQFRVTGGTVWLNEQTLEATGTFSADANGTWAELFSGTGMIDLDGLNDNELVLSQLTPTSLPAAMRPAALPVAFSSVRLMPTELQYEGTLALPEFVGGFSVTPQHFLLSSDGLRPAGGFVTVPDIDVSLFGVLQVRTGGLGGGYDAEENEIQLHGNFTIKSLIGSGGPSITATFPQGNGIGIGPNGVDFNGSITASDLGVVPGLFTLKNLSLSVNVQDSTLISIGGGAKVKLVNGVEIDGSFNIINGQLDAVSLSGGGLKFPIGSTGLFLQRVGGSVSGLAEGGPDPTFAGSVGFSFGPEYTINLPEAFGGSFENVSLLSIDLSASATIDFFDFANSNVVLQASATVRLLGGVATGTGSIRLDFRNVELEIDTTFSALAGFIQSQTHLAANASLNLTANGSATITIPESVPLIGGTELFGGHMFFSYRHDNTLANDYLAGYADIATWFGTFRTGARVSFDGTASILGLVPLNEAPSPEQISPQPLSANGGVPLGANRAFDVQSGTPFIVLSAAWSNDADDVPIRVVAPDGAVYKPANFGTVVDYVGDFTTSKRATVAIHEPMGGTWLLELPATDGLGSLTFEAFGGVAEPSVTFTSPTEALPGGHVPIDFTTMAENPGTSIDLYYDVDGQGFDGRPIAFALPAGESGLTWDTTALTAGVYHIYAVVTDDYSAPVFQYAPGTVRVGDEAARPLGDSFTLNDGFESAEGLDIAVDPTGNLVAVWRSFAEEPVPGTAVYVRRFSVSGEALGEAFRVSDAREANGDPVIAMDAGGGFVVAWEVDDDQNQLVVARRFEASGTPVGEVFTASNSADVEGVALAMQPSGGFAVAWVEEYEDELGEFLGSHMMIRRFAADGSPLGPAAPISSAMSGPDGAEKYHPALAASDGSWVAAWGVTNDDTDENSLFARVVGLDGMPLSNEIPVELAIPEDFEIDDEQYPILDAAADGSFVVAWELEDPDNNPLTEIRRFAADGAPIGEKILLHDVERPAVLAGVGGSFMLARQELLEGSDDYLLQQYGGDGSAIGPLVFVNERVESPILAGEMSGAFVAAWSDDDSNTYARVFEGAAAITAPRITFGAFAPGIPPQVQISFNKDVRGSVDVTDLIVTDLDRGVVVPSETFVVEMEGGPTEPTGARWLAVGGLPNGRYRASLPVGVIADAYGRVNETGHSFEFSIAAGDFDNNGVVDDRDIDLLFAEIAMATHSPQFDLTGDSLVTAADVRHLVESILSTQFGDVNLDRRVDRADVALLARNYGRAHTVSWTHGDFNGDGRVDLADLVIQQASLDSALPSAPAAFVAAKSARVSAARSKSRIDVGAKDSPLVVASISVHTASPEETPRRAVKRTPLSATFIDQVIMDESRNPRPRSNFRRLTM